jgi:hypothetical protein
METWLKCKVSPGQFSDEYSVQGVAFGGQGFSLFVPAELVDVAEALPGADTLGGWLRVEVAEREGQLALVRLPRQSLENGRFVTVQVDQLRWTPVRQEA